jgi:hypothetical protein
VLQAKGRRDALDRAIAELAAEPLLAEVVSRLVCLRGVSTLTALALTLEIGDWERFRPQSLGPFLGLTPSEDSTGQRHSQRGDRWSRGTGSAATTRTKARRPETSSPAGVVQQGSSSQASPGSRSASARTDSGVRSGRATARGRPRAPARAGTAKLVSGPKTPVSGPTATTYSSPASCRPVRKAAVSP